MNKEGIQIKSPVLYLQHHYELLKLEYEYEKEQFQQQTELMGSFCRVIKQLEKLFMKKEAEKTVSDTKTKAA